MQAFCTKCRTRREVLRPVVSPNPHGGDLVKGTCATCGGRIGTFVPRDSAQTPPAAGRT